MSNQFNTPLARDRAHRGWWRRLQWKQRLITWLMGGGAIAVIVGLLITLGIYIASNTAPVAHADTTQQVNPYDLVGNSSTTFGANQPAGSSATLQLYGTAHGMLIDIPADSNVNAHRDNGFYIDATCSISAASLIGTVIRADLTQAVIIDQQTSHIYAIGPPRIGAHSAYFWEITAAGATQTSFIPFTPKVQITATITFTRFGRGDIPVESYELILTLTISSDGTLTCMIDDP